MEWISQVKINKSTFEINHKSKILTMGSCFADNMGAYLADNKFDVMANPFGNIYNTVSLYNIFEVIEGKYIWKEEDIIERDELVFHYDFHTEIHAETNAELQKLIALKAKITKEFLEKSDVLILTLGTSWIYKLNASKKIVANCHKQNAALFEKVLLNIETQSHAMEGILEKINLLNPNLQIILTVSPVRHIRDGLPENSLSKAILQVLTNNIIEKHKQCKYFPSFEIMMDELRDYRFYDTDMIHPSKGAVAYIAEKFKLAYFPKKTQELCDDWSRINHSLHHRPLNPKSEAHQLFLNKLYDKVKDFSVHFDVKKEQELIKQQIL